MSQTLRGFGLGVVLLVAVGVMAAGCGRQAASPQTPPTPPPPSLAPATTTTPAAPSEAACEQAAAANALGFRLFGELRKDAKSPNLFLSPLSIHLALAMTYNGAAGSTAEAMAKVLGLSGKPLADVNAAAKDLLAQLAADKSDKLLLADSLWGDQGVSFLPDFIQANQDSYSAEVNTLDFGKAAEAAARINAWTKDKTGGKIPEIVSEDTVSGAALVLVNALYFKGQWSKPFDPKQTKDLPFHRAGGTAKTVPMMERSGSMEYHATEDYQAVRLGYGDGTTRMVVFLPRSGKTPAEVLAKLTAGSWSALSAQSWEGRGRLVLPRFKADYGQSLVKALTALGMGVAFSSAEADFSKIANLKPLFISALLHKCVVEVNEKGTEAAAATAVVASKSAAMPSKEFMMVVDRPFAFAIEHVPTGALLFVGVIGEPG